MWHLAYNCEQIIYIRNTFYHIDVIKQMMVD